ncbi:MAG: hypothetical protein ACR2HH_10390 [Chthoniobacterales bacterium]
MPAAKNRKGKAVAARRKKPSNARLAASAFLGTKTMTVVQKAPTFTTVVWLDLPGGTYLLKATGAVNRLDHNVGSDLPVEARLTGGGTTLPFSYFHGPTADPVSTANIELAGRIDLATKGRIAVECTHIDFADTHVQAVNFQLFAQEVEVQNNG